jgi:putative flippase GtrA
MSLFNQVLLRKFIKYGFVGASGVVVDYTVTFIFRDLFGINQFVSNAIGFAVAASINYVLNRKWTFRSDNPDITQEYIYFMVISMLGLLINSVVLWLCVTYLNWNFYFAKLVAIAFTTIWNFFANLLFTFKKK